MTKKKAIEAALRKYDDDGSAEVLADRAYEAGRIAGLREAAKRVWKKGKKPITYGCLFDYAEEIRQWANALAKKARGR